MNGQWTIGLDVIKKIQSAGKNPPDFDSDIHLQGLFFHSIKHFMFGVQVEFSLTQVPSAIVCHPLTEVG